MIQQQRVMSIPAILSVHHRAPAAASALPWYLAGGAPTPIAVYQPKGAASLAASYVNLVNPGTYNAAPGVAPTLVANGWSFNGTSQYLTTGIVPASGYSAVISFTGAENNLNFLTCFGEYDVGAHFFIGITGASVNVATFGSGGENTSVPGGGLAAGTMAIAGNTAYINGVAKATIPAWQKSATLPIYLGAYNSPAWLYVPYSTFCAAAIWNTSTNHATWMPLVMAACALI